LLNRFDLKDIYGRTIPINPHTDLAKFDGETTIDKKKIYSSTINDINWAAIISRSNLTHSHTKLARYITNPGPKQFKQLKQLFGYLKKTVDYDLIYTKNNGEGKISIYSDVNYGDYLDSRKLTKGYIIFKGKNVIAWHSKL